MNRLVGSIVLLVLAVLSAAAQLPAQDAATASPRLVSPEVHADRTITFRFLAPRAAELLLRFSAGQQRTWPMSRDSDGVWSVTVGPVDPEIYWYSFLVDGAKAIDTSNPVTRSGITIDGSIVEVPGDPPRFDQLQDVPHGELSTRIYKSQALQIQRGVVVYLPPDYQTRPQHRYPVLYLFHGDGGSETDWSRDGRAGIILDNLIAQRKTTPMIVVMSNNIPTAAASGSGMPVRAAFISRPGSDYPLLQKELLTDLIPFIDRTYRTLADRGHRAIAGLSSGGGTALNVGLNNLDTFAWVASFSSGAFGGVSTYPPFDIERMAPGLTGNPALTNQRLRLLYLSCGSHDSRLPYQHRAVKLLREDGINLVSQTFTGAHEWKVWRRSLADLAPRLFQPAAAGRP